MGTVRRVFFGIIGAGALLALAGCPSPFLAAIKDTVAKFPFSTTIFKFVTQWGDPTPQYTFGPPLVVKVDPAGKVYVADSSFRIRKFDSSGNLQSVFDVAGATGFSGTVYDMAFDSLGDLYVATSGKTKILKYSRTGANLGWSTAASVVTPVALAVDLNSGNLFVVDAGQTPIKVLQFDPSGAETASWDGTGNATGGTLFSNPKGICVDRNGAVYVADPGLVPPRVQIYYPTSGSYGGTLGTGIQTLTNPTGVSADSGSTPVLYIADGTRIVKTDGSTGTALGTFSAITNAAVDITTGNIYGADTVAAVAPALFNVGVIREYSNTGTAVTTWGGNALTANGLLTTPAGITYDSSGNIYVSDLGNGRIQKFTSSGGWQATWNPGAGNYSPFLGSIAFGNGKLYAPSNSTKGVYVIDPSLGSATAITNGLTSPAGVTVDSAGNIYVADYNANKVFVYDPTGYGPTRTIGSPGSDGGAQDGELQEPTGVAVDSAGNVYVMDTPFFILGTIQPHMIQKFDKNGNFVKAWGTSGTGDGQITLSFDITIDKYDNLYVCDFAPHRIEKFDTNGNFLGKWGSVGVGNGGYSWPMDMAIDSKGDIAVSDSLNDLVQVSAPNP